VGWGGVGWGRDGGVGKKNFLKIFSKLNFFIIKTLQIKK
jgi:hypothetical protein